MKNIKFISLSLVSCLALLANSAFAAPPKKELIKSQKDHRYDCEEIAMVPDLPHIPPYTGQVEAVRTQSFINAHNGPCYHVGFLVNERPDQVLGFYKSVLKQNKWDELAGDSRSERVEVSANRGSHMVTIVVTPLVRRQPASAGGKLIYKSQVSIQYSALASG